MTKKKNNKIDFRHNIKLYLDILLKYKVLFIGMLGLVFLIEVSHLVVDFLFKIIIDKGTAFTAGTVTKEAFVNILFVCAGIFILNIGIRSVSKFGSLHFINRLDGNLIKDLKTRFFNHIVHLSYGFHTSHKTGSLISRLTRGGGAIESMTDVIVFNVAPVAFQFITVALALIYFDWVAAVVVTAMVLCFTAYSVCIISRQKEANVAMNDAEDIEKGNIADMFTNIDSIKYFGKECVVKKQFDKLSTRTRLAQLFAWDYYRALDAGQILIVAMGTFFLLLFPLMRVVEGTMTLGTMVFIYTAYGNVVSPLYGFIHGVRNFYRAMANFQSLFEYDKIKNDIKDKADAENLMIDDGVIEFKKVGFAYHKQKLFDKFSLKIQKNMKVAFVGHSGSGKSSLVKLLYRLYDVDSGKILIDGKNIISFKQESLRSELSIVPQECVLFDDTIYNNIKFSRPGATRAEVLAAIKFAQLDKIVAQFPNNIQTIVGERGVKLSGGEKQRVSIARALLADKKVLILDEATSALDSETEHEIQKSLEKLMKGRTSIIIAHRLSTIMTADKIVVLDKGKIVQMGTHDELINQKGQYKKLWNLQKGNYIA